MLMSLDFKKPKEKKAWLFFKHYWPYLSLAFLFLILLFLLSPYLFRSWLKYPEALKAQIAWRYFQASFEGVCREECLAKRQHYASIWRLYSQKNPDFAQTNFPSVFTNGPQELQTALVKIMAADNQDESLPALLAQVIADEQASAETKRLIVSFFPQAFNDETWQANLRAMIVDKSLPLNDRIYAVKLLASFPTLANFQVLKTLILENVEEALLTSALYALTNWQKEEFFWSENEVEILTNLIISSPTGILRWRRLWLLESLIKNYPEKIKTILTNLATNESLDKITRGLASEALLSNFNLNISTPLPSAQEWQEFYESL